MFRDVLRNSFRASLLLIYVAVHIFSHHSMFQEKKPAIYKAWCRRTRTYHFQTTTRIWLFLTHLEIIAGGMVGIFTLGQRANGYWSAVKKTGG